MESPREIWLDFDDTVITDFGTKEDSKVGYNPRHHGRRSLVTLLLTGFNLISSHGYFDNN